jgi:hypothetical protein
MANAIGNNGGRLYSFASQPVLIDCNFVVDAANGNGLGIRSLKGQGVKNVFMHTSATPLSHRGYLNPNPAVGYALVQLDGNYNRYLGGFSGFASPTSGSPIQINSGTAGLTVHNPYIIASVGQGPQGAATIAPVADVSGSLASKYFMLYDSYGNSFCVWFSVSGVGSPPNLGLPLSPAQVAAGVRGLSYVQQSISTNASAATIGAALVLTIENLPSGIQGVYSFTATGTTTVTVTSTLNAPLGGIPQDGSQAIPQNNSVPVPIWFTISSGSATAGSVWTDGSGDLYTVSTTIAGATLLKTSGTSLPTPASGTLTFVSGTGSTTALTYSAAVAGLATGFTFALTVSDTNLADWQGVGLPVGLTPSVGQSFIATTTGAGGSTGTAIAAGISGITSIEVIGNPNLSFAPQPSGGSAYVGGFLLVQFLAPTSTSVTTLVPTAPASGTTVGMSFYVDYRFSPSNSVSTNGTG